MLIPQTVVVSVRKVCGARFVAHNAVARQLVVTYPGQAVTGLDSPTTGMTSIVPMLTFSAAELPKTLPYLPVTPCLPFRYRHTVSLGSVAIMCGFCKPPQTLEASKGCADCKSNFCNECFKLYHPWGTPRAQHEHILPTNNFRPKVCSSSVFFSSHTGFYLSPLCLDRLSCRRS